MLQVDSHVERRWCCFCWSCVIVPRVVHSFAVAALPRTPRLQNFFTHIRKLPHFDTRFGAAQTRSSPTQKRAICIYPGRSVGAFLLSEHMSLEGQFFGSKRVSKWGNFLISINFFCKRLVAQDSECFVSTWIFKMSRKIPNLSGVVSVCRALRTLKLSLKLKMSRKIPNLSGVRRRFLRCWAHF